MGRYVSPAILRPVDRTIFGSGLPSRPDRSALTRQDHSPLLSRCRSEGLLAIEMVVPCGGTGSRGGCERGSEGEVEGGAGGFSTGGGGRGTLSRIVSKKRPPRRMRAQ